MNIREKYPSYIAWDISEFLAYMFGVKNYSKISEIRVRCAKFSHKCYKCDKEIKENEKYYSLTIMRESGKHFTMYLHIECFLTKLKWILEDLFDDIAGKNDKKIEFRPDFLVLEDIFYL